MKNKGEFIPSGDELKNLVAQLNCTASMINSILRERGVFCSSSEKINTVPNLITSFLSPEESYELLSSIKTKEKIDKVNFRDFEIDIDADLLEQLSCVIEPDQLIKSDYVNFEISDFNDFTSLDGRSNNSIILEFEVCRKDILDDWYMTDKFFKGSVELKKNSDGMSTQLLMNVKLNHTSPETKEIAENIISLVENRLIDNKVIKISPHNGKVLFDDFENENRVAFLSELAKQHIGYLFYYKKIDDVHFNPDKESKYEDNLELTSNFLEKKIEQYRVKGDLDEIISIKWKHIHPYVKVTKVVASYSIEYESYSGECKVSYEFSDYGRKNPVNPELCITFVNVKIKGASPTKLYEIQNAIMREIEIRKAELLRKYKIADA
ncbi:hypothetical protein DZA65_02828 [Dickeya dianthicola]|uniref:GAPS4b N-terminal domain-containing protein n=2 Tax=Enterobacterales TaxID=91347 RepID=A0ABX9NNM8_9GAMM|nr:MULTISPECIES: hypothetical protein [Enterobacterales]AYC19706.1 hypothetical protein DZA65_02828 [Dickeya dianthicola]MBI0438926.1 hypothetical protein [Dickeya dianthicola]MBI0449219.1 hypothetical protein [Dickeya dianthicola]MBI0453723.1 hypothetical protein [Dickeya dianthicola]MBI0458015.1 hypothetical protein [Dickeya dianthicola]